MDEFFITPPEVVEALLAVETFKGRIWEPAAGEGHISEVLKAHGLDVVSSDIEDRGYGQVADFFDTTIQCDHIITNPPFSMKLWFAEHALYVAQKKVALLLPLTFLETPRRAKFLTNSPLKAMYLFSYRIWLSPKGYRGTEAKKKCFAWFVWEKRWKGEPVIRWLKKTNT